MSSRTSVEFSPIPLIEHTDQLPDAAQTLITHGGAYLVAKELGSPHGSFEAPQGKAIAIIDALNRVKPGWANLLLRGYESTPQTDVGFHGNQARPDTFLDNDYLHFHYNQTGSHQLTIAQATQQYRPVTILDSALHALLRRGETVDDYVDPKTFQRADVSEGMGVLFRLNRPDDGACLLHDFRTTSRVRQSPVYLLARTVSGTVAEFLR